MVRNLILDVCDENAIMAIEKLSNNWFETFLYLVIERYIPHSSIRFML